MARINKTKYTILGLLHYRPMSGYDLKKLTDVSISHFWNENFGHIYPVLKKMEGEGLLSKSVTVSEGKPDRNVYAITGEGREEFLEWMKQPVEPLKLRFELLLKVFFGGMLTPEEISSSLEAEKKIHLAKLEGYAATKEHLNSPHHKEKKQDASYWLMALNYGIRYSQSMIDWCDESILLLRQMEEERE